MEGIIDIIDKPCAEELSKDRGEAWYLMPKAKEYRVDYNTPINQKLDDMIYFARILETLHSRGYAHRDIKRKYSFIKRQVVFCGFGFNVASKYRTSYTLKR